LLGRQQVKRNQETKQKSQSKKNKEKPISSPIEISSTGNNNCNINSSNAGQL